MDCSGEWGCWGACTSPSIIAPLFTRKRFYVTKIYAKNGGAACLIQETENCVPSVCYSAESSFSGFGAKMMGLKPIQTLPPSHPSLTTCSLKSTDIIPKTDPAAKSCSGPEVFYAVDATSGTSKSTLATGRFNLFLDPNTTAIKHVLTFHSLIQSSSLSLSSLSSLDNT